MLKVSDNDRAPAARSGLAPVFPQVAFARLGPLNRLYRRRAALAFTLAGRAASIAAAWPPPLGATSRSYRLRFSIDGSQGEAVLSGALVEAVVAAADPLAPLPRLQGDHAGVLTEFALREELAALEQQLGCRLEIATVRLEPAPPAGADPSVLTFTIAVEGLERSWCALCLPDSAAVKLVGLFDRCAANPAPAAALAVALCVRVAATRLSIGEVSRLAPGDVVLADHYCRRPRTALAVIAEHLVAALALTEAGAELVTAPLRGRGSAWEWIMDDAAGKAGPEAACDGALEDLPVKLVFELGRVELSLREIRQLAPGAVVALARPLEESVDVVANGRRIGRGNLIQIGDSLGVRLARLFDND